MQDSFFTDAPVSSVELDRFNRWPFALRLAQTLAARRDTGSIVIGLHGAWGEGKTTVLNFIEQELHNYNHVIVVRFNPWRFSDKTRLVQDFFRTLSDALGRAIPGKKKTISRWFNAYASIQPENDAAPDPAPPIAKPLNKLYADVKLRLEQLLAQEGKRLVIFMDDIDRLEKPAMQTVFRIAKLSGDFALTSYILAFDEEVVAAALNPQSSGVTGGRSFLEKIIQVPLHLPLVDRNSLRNYCLEGVSDALGTADIELSETQLQTFVSHFVEGLEIRLQTPRLAKRYCNALTFALPILKDEVNPVDLMLIEGLRVLYPLLYEAVRENANFFLGFTYKKDKELEIEGILENFSFDERIAARKLLKSLFPRINNSSYGREWEEIWAKEQRATSLKYFPRFFSYAIPEGDISDQEVAVFLNQAECMDVSDILGRLESMVSQRNAESLILRIQVKAQSLSPHCCTNLALALARTGHIFPKNSTVFPPFSQAGMLVAKLVVNLPEGNERLDLCEKIVSQAEPLDYAIECFRWMRDPEKRDESERVLSEKAETRLGQALARRILALAQQTLLYKNHPYEALAWLNVLAKWGSREISAAYVADTFRLDKHNVLSFLKACMRKNTDFTRNHYTSLSYVLDPAVVLTALRRVYGADLDSPRYEYYVNNPSDKTLAHQFAYTHYSIQKEESFNRA